MTDFIRLKSALRVLSADAAEQIAYLLSIGLPGVSAPVNDETNVDELALEFDDLLTSYKACLSPTSVEVHSLDALDALLDEMSEHPRLWTVASLRHSPEWKRVRELARRCLELTQ